MNHQGSAIIARVAQYATAVLGLIFFILIYASDSTLGTGVSGGLMVAYVAMGLGAVILLAFAIKGLTRKSVIGLGAFAALLAVSYALADGTVKPGTDISTTTAKFIGAGITMFVIAAVAAVGLILFGEVRRLLK